MTAADEVAGFLLFSEDILGEEPEGFVPTMIDTVELGRRDASSTG